MVNDSPCHGCVAPKRHVVCHGTCSEYHNWKATEQIKKDAERKRREDEAAMFSSFKFKKAQR